MQQAEKLKPLQRFWRIINLHKNEVISIYIYSFFNGVVNLSLPLGIQAIINLIGGGQISTSWIVLVIIVLIGISAAGLLQILQLFISENIQQKIFARSAFEFAYRLPKLKSESINRFFIPELVNRFFDTLTVQKGISKILIDYSTALLQVFFGLILLSFYHPFFVVFGLLLIIMFILIVFFTAGPGLRTSIKESKHKYELVHWLEELGRSMDTFKLAGNTDLHLEKTDRITIEYIKARKAHFRILLWQYAAMIAFKIFVAAGLLILGGILVMEQQMNIGQFVAAEIIILLIFSSTEKLVTGAETIYDVLTSLEKMGEVTDIPLESTQGYVIHNTTNEKGISIAIENLSYTFPNEKSSIFNHLNLNIKKGERLAISGYNGSGKSLLLSLIAGLYEDFSGSITYNDIPLRNLNINELRNLIGDSLAKEDVFEGTIVENISMGKKNITIEQVINACKVTGLHDFINTLHESYNTILLPEGKTLPKSIILKIMLARCIAAQPGLILLEDNLNRLEPEARNKLNKHLLDKNNNWTLVAVSNDPDFIKLFDRIIVLNEGKIVDEGTFEELCQNPHWANTLFK
jgi:ABC-type bacteriocin/lantibiotic exporter with double-glycine peptidase domain